MVKVILSSADDNELHILAKRIAPLVEEVGQIRFERCRPAHIPMELSEDVQLLVFNSQHYGIHLKQSVSEWRYQGYLGPILMLTKIPDPTQLTELDHMHGVVVLDKPYDPKDLVGISKKLLMEVKVNQRKFRRFPTNQTAHLESYKTSLEISANVDNISLGGVCIKGDIKDIAKGDLLKVEFQLDEVKKSHVLNAKVVWTAGKVGDIDRMAGLLFVPKEEVYSQLLGS